MTKTVAILGAGASWDYGLPTGNELLDEVERLCRSAGVKSGRGSDGDSALFLELVQLADPGKVQVSGAPYLLRQFGDLISGQLPPSIDWFLGQRFGPSFEAIPYLGKLAIAWIIAKHELSADKAAEVTLRQAAPTAGRPVQAIIGQHWLKTFWQSLGVRNAEDFDRILVSDSLRIVTFNYDRTVDQFLLNRLEALHRARGMGASSGKPWLEQLQQLDICHVYGHVGSVEALPYGSTRRVLEKRAIDGIDSTVVDQLRTAANSLVIVEDERQAVESAMFEKAKSWIANADRVVFLGFGFDPTNIERLGFPDNAKHFSNMFATTYGIGAIQRDAVCSKIVAGWPSIDDFGRSRMHMHDQHQAWTVDDYLRHYQPFKDLARG